MRLNQAFALGKNDVFILHNMVRRQAAIFLAQTHRATCQNSACAHFFDRFDLDIDSVRNLVGEQVMMIRSGTATG